MCVRSAAKFMRFHKFWGLGVCLALAGAAWGQTMPRTWAPVSMMLTPNGMTTAVHIGHKAFTDMLHVSISLPYRDQQGMQQFVDSVSDPKSPHYRQFLTPDQVGARFGVSPASLQKVRSYLEANGFAINRVAKSRLVISATGTVAQAEAAFNTRIDEFAPTAKGTATGETRFSYTVPPSVPADIGSLVVYIGGIENFTKPIRRQTQYTPSQLQTLYSLAAIYNAPNNYEGQKRTVAISNYDGYRLSNVPLEYSEFDLPTPSGGVGSNISVVSIDGVNGNTYSTVEGEGDLDIQCVLAMAPLCNLIIYDDASSAPNGNSDPTTLLSTEAEADKADIITESYGWSGNTAFYESCYNLHLQMAGEGITYLCAAGDSGAQGVPQEPYPDEDPNVLIVGGTSVLINSSGARTSEVVWNDSYGAGGGGWTVDSNTWNVLPSYQVGNGVPTNIPYRLVPDVALDADPNTGYEIYVGGQLFAYGGTSCSSPTMAGGLADCAQDIIANGGLPPNSKGYQRFGRINDLLYSFNGNAAVFYDITSGNNGTLPNGLTLTATTGWDNASGWGCINFAGFVGAVLGPVGLSSVAVSPNTVIGGATATGTVTLSSAATVAETVTLSSSTGDATVPGSVTVAAGATTATFTITTSAVTTSATATITATQGSTSVNAQLTINPAALTGLTVLPTSVEGGSNSTGTVTLSGGAPSGGITVNLSSGASVASVPQTVTVPVGSASTTFTIDTSAVTQSTSALITASLGASTEQTTLNVTPTTLQTVTVSPTSVLGGVSATGTVTLGGQAPAGGFIVNLSSSLSSVQVPSQVTVGAGSTSATFSVATSPVNANVSATLTGTAGGISKTSTLTVTAAVLSTLTMAPISVVGGAPSTGTIMLSGKAGPGGAVVALSSGSSSAVVPATATVPAGGTTATFVVKTTTVSSNTTVSITGTLNGASLSTGLTIDAITVANLTVLPSSVAVGVNATGTVTLSQLAPTGGITVNLSATNGVAVPGTVSVTAGTSAASFTVGTSGVSVAAGKVQTSVITATYGSSTQTAGLTITAAVLSGLTITPNPILGGNTATGTVSLNGPAGSGGVSVKLISNTIDAVVPATVVIPGGASSTTFSVATKAVAKQVTAIVTAKSTAGNLTAGLTIAPPVVASISLSHDIACRRLRCDSDRYRHPDRHSAGGRRLGQADKLEHRCGDRSRVRDRTGAGDERNIQGDAQTSCVDRERVDYGLIRRRGGIGVPDLDTVRDHGSDPFADFGDRRPQRGRDRDAQRQAGARQRRHYRQADFLSEAAHSADTIGRIRRRAVGEVRRQDKGCRHADDGDAHREPRFKHTDGDDDDPTAFREGGRDPAQDRHRLFEGSGLRVCDHQLRRAGRRAGRHAHQFRLRGRLRAGDSNCTGGVYAGLIQDHALRGFRLNAGPGDGRNLGQRGERRAHSDTLSARFGTGGLFRVPNTKPSP